MTDNAVLPWPVPPALGIQRVHGTVKSIPDDFIVREIPNWVPTGSGEHVVLWIEKRGCNTEWVARQLARFASVPARAVSFAGRKDRVARTWQWFSVHLPGSDVDWQAFDCEGVTLHHVERHSRKIRVGALKGNAFEITLGALNRPIDPASVERLRSGVPNYFGPQRFGNGSSNLKCATAIANGRRVRKSERQLAVSAARSALFNLLLADRVAADCWATPDAGDVVQFEGNRSVYLVDLESLDATRERASRLDLHPTGPLWGRGEMMTQGAPGSREQSVAEVHPLWASAAESAGATMARRSLRVLPANLSYALTQDSAKLHFELPAGAFATALLNELLVPDDA
ncbi:MAG: tRNA pseudouridine(13) synthase TruD [Pseudomonadota bacterium]